jgi:hypothetical protein
MKKLINSIKINDFNKMIKDLYPYQNQLSKMIKNLFNIKILK